jgi:uncharacterized protein
MPLVNSPIDGSPMRKVVRYGVEVDICNASGGVWLDKGELEKLASLIKEDAAAERAARSQRERPREAMEDDDREWDYEDYDRKHGGRGRSRLREFFDF